MEATLVPFATRASLSAFVAHRHPAGEFVLNRLNNLRESHRLGYRFPMLRYNAHSYWNKVTKNRASGVQDLRYLTHDSK